MTQTGSQRCHRSIRTALVGVTLSNCFAAPLWSSLASMTCTTDVAIVELTSDGEQITVSSGFQGATPGQPQTTPVKESNIIPWNGFGRHQWSYLDFTFANQTFSLSSSFDTAYPNSKWETFLSIGDDIYACVEKYNRDPFDDFIALKFDAGQCWNLEHQAWSFNCY